MLVMGFVAMIAVVDVLVPVTANVDGVVVECSVMAVFVGVADVQQVCFVKQWHPMKSVQ